MLDVVRIKVLREHPYRVEHSHWEVQDIATVRRISRHKTRAGAKARLEIERRKLARESKNND